MWKRQKKTNVNKETILDLAKKLQENDLKNENTLREVIQELSQMTGREVPKDKNKEKTIVDNTNELYEDDSSDFKTIKKLFDLNTLNNNFDFYFN